MKNYSRPPFPTAPGGHCSEAPIRPSDLIRRLLVPVLACVALCAGLPAQALNIQSAHAEFASGRLGAAFELYEALALEGNIEAMKHAGRMLERGEGWLLQTASAAGILTDVMSCAYSVTKHAAVAFAEWLAITYGDRGIRVACLCPQGVRTPMLEGAAAFGGGAPHLTRGALEPDAVADAVLAGLDAGHFLILPHPEVHEYAQRKAQDPDRWLAGMRRMRTRLYGAMG